MNSRHYGKEEVIIHKAGHLALPVEFDNNPRVRANHYTQLEEISQGIFG
jgi:hypothetical protein